MNLVPALLLRSVVATALVATTLLMAIVGATPALAQGVDCERVPYNEVIIVVCTSGGVDTPTPTPSPTLSPTPTPSPTPSPSPTPEPVASVTPSDSDADADAAGDTRVTDVDGDTSTSDDDDLADDTDDADDIGDDLADDLLDRPDGGDPGTGSAGADADLDDAAAGGPAEPEIAGGEPDDGADNDALAEADAGQDATTPAGNEVEEGVSDTPLLVADPESSVLPLVAGITAFLGGGGALFLAARRVNRSDADLD